VWQRHFYDGITSALPGTVLPAGVDFAWARPAARAAAGPTPARAATSERLWDQIRAAHAQRPIDAVISYCFGADVEAALVERTIALGVPWINFFCDSTYAFDLVASLARVTSLNWFPESAATESYRAAGRPFLCRPYAVNPAALPDATCETADHALGFVGAPTGNRVLRLAALWLRRCRVTVRGEGWDRIGRPSLRGDRRMRGSIAEGVLVWVLARAVSGDAAPLTDEEMVRFLRRCRVVLGLNEGRDLNGTYQSYLKLRDIEFPGYGCCYLTQHNDDIARAFDVGREVLTFRDAGEAAALARRCARHPDEARAIGGAARRRVHDEHSWAARLRELAAAL
jgi:glycosyl transferase family 1